MSAYAEGTSVTPERSQMEIAATVRRFGAASFAVGWDRDRAVVTFVAHSRQIRFLLDLPTDWRKFATTPAGRTRKEAEARTAMEGEVRRRWRALALAIKAKLEVVETGISTFEAEFLPHTVLPDGRTVAEHVLPRVDEAIAAGQMPTSLLAIERGDR